MNGPILIFGMPRSGTTWVGKLFDSHPDTLYRHEPDSLTKLDLPPVPEHADTVRYRAEVERFVASLAQFRDPKVVGKQPLFAKSYESEAALLAYRISVLAAKAMGRMTHHASCIYRPTGAGHTRVRVVWKSIESCLRLRICTDALPNARAIYLVRHPCGFVASQLRGIAAHNFPAESVDGDQSWMLRRLLETDTGRRYRSDVGDVADLSTAECLAWEWMLTQERVLADVAQCDRVLTVRYEDVCKAPFVLTRNLFEFVGLSWQPQTEAFVRASTNAGDTSYYGVFRRSRASAERWRTELPSEVQARVLEIARRGKSVSSLLDDTCATPVASAVSV